MNAATYVAELLVWSAAHLVWQATLACAVFSVWQKTRKPSPEQRHTVAIAILASLPILFIATAAATHASLVLNAREGSYGAFAAHSSESLGRMSAVFDRAVATLPVLIVIWCAGMALSMARMARSHREIHAIRMRLRDASPEVVARVEALASRAGVAREPRVLMGDIASGGPFVVGVRRPVLVLPAVELSPDEWNAVILHELAHIRRRDYVVNRAVQILNALLWFHPSIRMLAGWAAEAREECCDADAARLSATPIALARALVRIAEHDTPRVLAVAATSGSLMNRIQCMLAFGKERKAAGGSTLAPMLVACGIYVGGIAICCVAAPSVDSLAITGAFADALPAQRILINAVDPAGRFTLTELNGRVAMATVGNVVVDQSALRVHGRRVTVVSNDGTPALSLDFDSRGGISWTPRQLTTKVLRRE